MKKSSDSNYNPRGSGYILKEGVNLIVLGRSGSPKEVSNEVQPTTQKGVVCKPERGGWNFNGFERKN